MQPYLFPYIGYFQLIHAVDKFVVYDDVQYIQRGFINRNKILVNQKEHLFTFSVKKAPRQYNINERYFTENFYHERDSFLKTIERSYKNNTDNFSEIYNLLRECLDVNVEKYNVAQINERTIRLLCDYMNVNVKFIKSSELNSIKGLKGQERILNINLELGSSHYINAIGGEELYSKEYFLGNGIDLNFLKTKSISYKQNNPNFVPNLSIIDVLMFNSKEEIRSLLAQYELV